MIIGVDPSSTTMAFVSADSENQPIVLKAKLAKKSGPEACMNAAVCVGKYVAMLEDRRPGSDGPRWAYVEAPVVARGGIRTTMVQSFTSGALQGALHAWGFTVVLVQVNSWKKAVIGKGGVSKEEVAAGIQQRWPALYAVASGDQDIIDAAAIYLFGAIERPF